MYSVLSNGCSNTIDAVASKFYSHVKLLCDLHGHEEARVRLYAHAFARHEGGFVGGNKDVESLKGQHQLADVRQVMRTYTLVSSGNAPRVLFNAVSISSGVPSKNRPHPVTLVQ